MYRWSTPLTVAITLAVVSIAAIPETQAQPAPSVDKKKAAKSYVDAGLAAQDTGDYETALTFYAKAYELVPHPTLLFNMAQAHRLAGRPKQALELYEQYVAADPNGAQAKTAREFITALKSQLAAEAARKTNEADAARRAEEARLAEDARKADEARKAAEAARHAEEMRRDATTTPPESEAPEPTEGANPGKTWRITGLVGGSAGVVALGIGTYFGLRARSLSNELSQPGAAYTPQKEADGKAANRNMIIFTSVGGALVIGGGVAYWLGHKQGAAKGVAIAPAWNGGPGVVVQGAL